MFVRSLLAFALVLSPLIVAAQTNPFVAPTPPAPRAVEDLGGPRGGAQAPGPAQAAPAQPAPERTQNRNTPPASWPAATRT